MSYVARLQNKCLFFQNETNIGYYSFINVNNVQGDKNHPYSQIMRDWYQRLKEMRSPTPKVIFYMSHFDFSLCILIHVLYTLKVLGLSACLVVKGTTEWKLRQDIKDLEQVRTLNL